MHRLGRISGKRREHGVVLELTCFAEIELVSFRLNSADTVPYFVHRLTPAEQVVTPVS